MHICIYIYIFMFIYIYIIICIVYIYIYIHHAFAMNLPMNLREMEKKCWDLMLEEHCQKLFCLIDNFWEVIAGAYVNLNWLIKIRSHLGKIEKEQEKVKRKKLSSLSRNSSFKKMVFERFN